jgi:hypothetical protein
VLVEEEEEVAEAAAVRGVLRLLVAPVHPPGAVLVAAVATEVVTVALCLNLVPEAHTVQIMGQVPAFRSTSLAMEIPTMEAPTMVLRRMEDIQ